MALEALKDATAWMEYQTETITRDDVEAKMQGKLQIYLSNSAWAGLLTVVSIVELHNLIDPMMGKAYEAPLEDAYEGHDSTEL